MAPVATKITRTHVHTPVELQRQAEEGEGVLLGKREE